MSLRVDKIVKGNLVFHDHNDDYLSKTNTTAFTPDADYEPATKKYVDDNAGGGGSLTVEESGGTPSVADVTKIVFENSNVTDDGSNQVTVAPGVNFDAGAFDEPRTDIISFDGGTFA